ncbi:hypothetical protein F5Y19DRAFT_480086 [Xylariaceae sp. FL1651]|nr:hypothetical protein F5Y19DRAFT_480086 [Xylariaceae sp. FL1651]
MHNIAKPTPIRTQDSILFSVRAEDFYSYTRASWNAKHVTIFKRWIQTKGANYKTGDLTPLLHELDLDGYGKIQNDSEESVESLVIVKVKRKLDNVRRDFPGLDTVKEEKEDTTTSYKPMSETLEPWKLTPPAKLKDDSKPKMTTSMPKVFTADSQLRSNADSIRRIDTAAFPLVTFHNLDTHTSDGKDLLARKITGDKYNHTPLQRDSHAYGGARDSSFQHSKPLSSPDSVHWPLNATQEDKKPTHATASHGDSKQQRQRPSSTRGHQIHRSDRQRLSACLATLSDAISELRFEIETNHPDAGALDDAAHDADLEIQHLYDVAREYFGRLHI